MYLMQLDDTQLVWIMNGTQRHISNDVKSLLWFTLFCTNLNIFFWPYALFRVAGYAAGT